MALTRRDVFKVLTALPMVKSVQVARLEPKDIIVLEVDGKISEETAARLKAVTEDKFPGHKVMVLGDGLKMKIMRHG